MEFNKLKEQVQVLFEVNKNPVVSCKAENGSWAIGVLPEEWNLSKDSQYNFARFFVSYRGKKVQKIDCRNVYFEDDGFVCQKMVAGKSIWEKNGNVPIDYFPKFASKTPPEILEINDEYQARLKGTKVYFLYKYEEQAGIEFASDFFVLEEDVFMFRNVTEFVFIIDLDSTYGDYREILAEMAETVEGDRMRLYLLYFVEIINIIHQMPKKSLKQEVYYLMSN